MGDMIFKLEKNKVLNLNICFCNILWVIVLNSPVTQSILNLLFGPIYLCLPIIPFSFLIS